MQIKVICYIPGQLLSAPIFGRGIKLSTITISESYYWEKILIKHFYFHCYRETVRLCYKAPMVRQ